MVNTKKYRTMIVEDDPMAARHLEMVLDKMEEIFISYVIENALMAEAYCCREHIDLILMDVQMPRMNGYDATRQIRKLRDQKKVSIPVIAMTVNAFEEDRNEAFAAGMDEHVAKPVEIKKLMNKIVKYIRK